MKRTFFALGLLVATFAPAIAQGVYSVPLPEAFNANPSYSKCATMTSYKYGADTFPNNAADPYSMGLCVLRVFNDKKTAQAIGDYEIGVSDDSQWHQWWQIYLGEVVAYTPVKTEHELRAEARSLGYSKGQVDIYGVRGKPCHIALYDAPSYHKETWWYCNADGTYSDAYTFVNGILKSTFVP